MPGAAAVNVVRVVKIVVVGAGVADPSPEAPASEAVMAQGRTMKMPTVRMTATQVTTKAYWSFESFWQRISLRQRSIFFFFLIDDDRVRITANID